METVIATKEGRPNLGIEDLEGGSNIFLDPEKIARAEEIFKDAFIDPDTTIPDPETLLSLNGTPILWRGCKGFVCAVAKARKTTTNTLLASILLGRDESANGFQAREGCRVLVLDTEQARHDTQRIAERIARLCGKTRSDLRNRLQVLGLSQYSPDDIKIVMEYAISKFRPDVVFLDNWTDCVTAVNDEKECTQFSRDLRQLVEVYNLALFGVIHANESAAEAPKFRGWAQEEARKSDLTLYLQDMSETKNDAERGDYSKARFGKCRGKRPEGFAVSIDDNGLPCFYHHDPGATDATSSKYSDIVEAMPENGMEWGALKSLLIDKTNKPPRTVERWINNMKDIGVIKKFGKLYYPNTISEDGLPF